MFGGAIRQLSNAQRSKRMKRKQTAFKANRARGTVNSPIQWERDKAREEGKDRD
jgi:hypothetical protein